MTDVHTEGVVGHRDRHTQGEVQVEMKTDIGVMLRGFKNTKGSRENTRREEKGVEWVPPLSPHKEPALPAL